MPCDLRSAARGAGFVALVAASSVASGWLVGLAVQRLSGERMGPWILGRAAGVSSYLLLVALVLLGLVLSHPGRARIRRPSVTARLRLHASLAVFTLVLTVLHVVVLATDPYAGVGWWGALVPWGSSYRPLPVTLGVLGLYSGLAAGVTAALAGRLPRRAWWPVHKVAVVSLLLVWTHGVLAGIDTPALLGLYGVTGLLVVVVAISRYTTEGPNDRVADLAAAQHRELARAPGGLTRAQVLPEPESGAGHVRRLG